MDREFEGAAALFGWRFDDAPELGAGFDAVTVCWLLALASNCSRAASWCTARRNEQAGFKKQQFPGELRSHRPRLRLPQQLLQLLLLQSEQLRRRSRAPPGIAAAQISRVLRPSLLKPSETRKALSLTLCVNFSWQQSLHVCRRGCGLVKNRLGRRLRLETRNS